MIAQTKEEALLIIRYTPKLYGLFKTDKRKSAAYFIEEFVQAKNEEAAMEVVRTFLPDLKLSKKYNPKEDYNLFARNATAEVYRYRNGKGYDVCFKCGSGTLSVEW